MVFKPDQQKMQQLLSEAITVLCKNGLNYQSHVNVEALIGITLDDDEVFLVSVRETIQNMKQQQMSVTSPTYTISPAPTQRPKATPTRKRPVPNTFLSQQPEQALVETGNQRVSEPNEPPSKRAVDDANVIHIKGEQSDEEDTSDTIIEQTSMEQDQESVEPPGDGGGGDADEGDSYGTNQLEQFVDFATTSQSSDLSQVDNKAAVFASQAAMNHPITDPVYPMATPSLTSSSHQQVKSSPSRTQQVGTYLWLYFKKNRCQKFTGHESKLDTYNFLGNHTARGLAHSVTCEFLKQGMA